MGLFKRARSPPKNDSAVLALALPLPLPRPPKKKRSTTYPKTPPHQISHHQCTYPVIDPIGKPPSVNPVQWTPAKDPHPEPANDHALTSSRTHISSPLVTAREQQPWCTPTRMWLTSSENLSPHPKSQMQQNEQEQHSPPSATRSCARAMSQDYPFTGPSPGVNPTIYPSSLPLARGNLSGGVSPKDIKFFSFFHTILFVFFSANFSFYKNYFLVFLIWIWILILFIS